jgi:hypothetical protein
MDPAEPTPEPLRIAVPRLALQRAWLAVDAAARLTRQLRGPQDPVGIGLDTLRDQLEALGKRLQMEQRILAAGGLPSSERTRAEIAARLRDEAGAEDA